MIISHKHKYIFVGIPFSASSTISKELLENYDGEFILNKHTNIPTLLNEFTGDINEYFVFGIYRSPIEIIKSRYNKLRNNPENRFSDEKFARKNGGYVSEKSRKFSKLIRENDLTFLEYLKLNYRLLPYNNEFTINAPYLNFILDFNNLENDFELVLRKIGLKMVTNLDKTNSTKKRSDIDYNVPESIISKYFAPFLKHNSKYIPHYSEPKVNYFFYLVFLLTKKMRAKRTLSADKYRTLKNDQHFSENKFLRNKIK
jgi:hypothetical protein